MTSGSDVIVRSSTDADIAAIQAIYAHHVRHGTASFDEEPPDVAETAERRRSALAAGLPHLVAVDGDRVVGFAYASPFRPRPAYRFTVESTVYVVPDAQRRGIGQALMARLIDDTRAADRHQMIAAIGDSANVASIGLHAALGFVHAGTYRAVGFKFGRWLDVVLMQKTL